MPKPKTTPRKPAPKKPAPPPVDLNEVRELLAENAKAIVELRKLNAETNKQLATLGESVKATEKLNAETAKLIADIGVRADKALAASENALKVAEKNNQYISGHANGEGEILEIECYNTLLKMRKLNGIKLERLILGENNPEYGVEIDLVGINGKVTFPMEVKRTLEPEDVRRFNEVQVERFKEAFPHLAHNKQVIPVVIFALRKRRKNPANGKKEDPVQLALNAGIIVLQSTGENQLSPITDPEQVTTRTPKDKN